MVHDSHHSDIQYLSVIAWRVEFQKNEMKKFEGVTKEIFYHHGHFFVEFHKCNGSGACIFGDIRKKVHLKMITIVFCSVSFDNFALRALQNFSASRGVWSHRLKACIHWSKLIIIIYSMKERQSQKLIMYSFKFLAVLKGIHSEFL